MRQRYRETSESDSHDLLFGPADDDHNHLHDGPHREVPDGNPDLPRAERPRQSRREAREAREAQARQGRRRRTGRVVWIMAIVLIAVVGAATWLVVLPVYHYFSPSDYSGSGSGTVIVEVKPNDGAADIGKTLQQQDVVASSRAFSNAADGNSDSQNIQPGSYRLHSHMSAAAALSLLLNPSSRVNSDVTVTEGANVLDVKARLVAKPCNGKTNVTCGPGLSQAQVTKAFTNVKALGLPTDYRTASGAPTSVEGFLFPATYYFPENTAASAALQQMVTKFTDQARTTNFTARAKVLHITPYQELIIASIAQREARFPEDYARVARVILNRLRTHTPLKVDAASVYGAEVKGLDPDKVIYSTIDSPYNTYRNTGLPPTPISNPGADAMNGAAHPAKGNWTYYVNGDKAGHLFFTNNEHAFINAQRKCHNQGWGCAAP